MAAAHVAGIVRNHPFIDGNKRTGFVVGVLFLEINGCRFAAAEELESLMSEVFDRTSMMPERQFYELTRLF
jgi:death-on-curing family protein